MEFTKLKDGVVALSAFLFGHIAWMVMSVYSILVSVGPSLEQMIGDVVANVHATLQSETARTLLETYGLKPLVPALAIFMAVFLLHVHREILERIGRYVPPELVWHWMPGLRNVTPSRWHFLLGQLGRDYSFDRLRLLLEARYPATLEGIKMHEYRGTFNIFKSLVLLNCVLAIASYGNLDWKTFLLIFAFASAAAIVALLDVYHGRNQSYWAIERTLATILAEHGQTKNGMSGEASDWPSEDEMSRVKSFWCADRRQPTFSLSWSVPLVGNLRVLRESLSRGTTDAKPTDQDNGVSLDT